MKAPVWLRFLAGRVASPTVDDDSAADYLADAVRSFIVDRHRAHALSGLMFKEVAGIADESVEGMGELKTLAVMRLVHSGLKKDWLVRCADVLHTAGYQAMLLKGVSLDGEVYPHGYRSGADIDLLVRSCDLEEVVGLLSASGLLIRKKAEYGFEETWDTGGKAACEVDIHRALTTSVCNRIDYDSLWVDSVAAGFGKPGVLSRPSLEAQVLIAAINSARDMDFFGHGTIDVITLLTSSGFDRKKLWEMAESWRMRPVLYAQLYIVSLLVPALAGQYLPGDGFVRSWRRPLVTAFARSTLSSTGATCGRRLTQLWSQWILCESLAEVLGYQSRYLLSRVRRLLR